MAADGYDIVRLARQKGITVEQLLNEIDPTAFHEEQLRRIIRQVIRHWSQGRGSVIEAYGTGDRSAVQEVLNRLKAETSPLVQTAGSNWGGIVQQVGAWHTGEFAASVAGALDIDVSPLMRAEAIEPALRETTKQGALLIKDVDDQTAQRIADATFDAFESGNGSAQLRKDLKEVIDASNTRARLIARDQLGKLTGRLDELRQTEAGIASYIWSTVGDHRVRPAHLDREGEAFKWSEPPEDGHPGEPVACRCRARAVIPGME